MSTPLPFSSRRLVYRAVRQPADLAVFQAINDDPLGFQNSNASNIKLPSPADAERFMKSTAEDDLLGAVIWLPNPPASVLHDEEIRDPKLGVAIGEIHLDRQPPSQAHHRWTEIGIDILPKYQGKGYGAEAIAWALEYAFEAAGMHRVRIRVFEWNAGALKLYERLGFVHEGRERESLWHQGRWWDGLTLGMLEGEWRGAIREKLRLLEEEKIASGKWE